MDEAQRSTARDCLAAAEGDRMAFPQIVAALMAAGFESYAVDFRRAVAIYYLADGDSVELPAHRVAATVAPLLDGERMQAAIGEAQRQVPGYSYRGFCEKAAAAGCAGYVVSFVGRRAVYMGRTGEVHVERFPDQ
jgi:uncharacterized protein YbcV (DUF1398 family)